MTKLHTKALVSIPCSGLVVLTVDNCINSRNQ